MSPNYPACDFCGECSCCPAHDCQDCKGYGTPVHYTEKYMIRTKWWDSAFDKEREGFFGPYDSQQEGEEMMLKIRKEHSAVQAIFFAELYRESQVILGSYSRARKRP